MWTKTTKKFRRNKASNKACDADLDICKNNSLPVSGEEFAIVGKTPSADDAASMMMLKEMVTDRECDAQQPDVCKNNSSSTESQMTMSHGPSASGEEGRDEIAQMLNEIAQMPSRGSDEFESDEEGDDGEQREVDETLSAEDAVVDEVNDKGITEESPSVNDNGAEPTSEVAAEPNDATDIAKCTRMCHSLENMMHERVSSINQIRMILRDEIQADNGKSSSLKIIMSNTYSIALTTKYLSNHRYDCGVY